MAVEATRPEIVKQEGTDALYATWWFKDPKTVESGGGFTVGDEVRFIEEYRKKDINGDYTKDLRWWTGAVASEWVRDLTWTISTVGETQASGPFYAKGTRIVLGADSYGEYNIKSPVNSNFLELVNSSNTDSGTGQEDTLDHFEIEWHYRTGVVGSAGHNPWFTGSTVQLDADSAENLSGGTDGLKYYSEPYSPPSDATYVRVRIKPVAKTTSSDVEYWTGNRTETTYTLYTEWTPELSGEFSVDSEQLKNYKLDVSLINIDSQLDSSSDLSAVEKYVLTDAVEFRVYKGGEKNYYATSGPVDVTATQASFSFDLTDVDGEYYVCYRAGRLKGASKSTGYSYSDWSDLQGPYVTVPATPERITRCSAKSETSVNLEWTASDTADTYTIEYSHDKTLFDVSSDTTKVDTDSNKTNWTISGLDSGYEYFFRVRAVNEFGESAWTQDLVSVVLGKTPEAPTTWSSSTTAEVGEDLMLYWVHNAEDGSDQTYAQLELTVNGESSIVTIAYEDDDPDNTEEETISTYALDATEYSAGAEIQWRVRTAGVFYNPSGDEASGDDGGNVDGYLKTFGKWSATRTVKIYATPTLSLAVENSGSATITSFPITIKTLASGGGQTPTGYYFTIAATAAYDTTDNLGNLKYVSAGEQIYSRYVNSTMSVLTIALSPEIIDLEDNQEYLVSCTVSMNSGLTASATAWMLTKFDDEVPEPYASVYVKTDNYTATIRPFCEDENVTMAVYRREYDGSFTEISTGIKNNSVTVLDPHPALDYARYRIVATSKTTGRVGYSDIPGQKVGGIAVIIQWDEAWSDFDAWSDTEYAIPSWNGSMLKLPYNIDVSESTDIDVSFINYIGRAHPVNYYGTHLGETATWSTDIPKSDKDTVYALRRLAKWKGSVYVREPSGVGYWAHIKVSFSQRHTELVIPVTLDITRVEGGV